MRSEGAIIDVGGGRRMGGEGGGEGGGVWFCVSRKRYEALTKFFLIRGAEGVFIFMHGRSL